MFILGFILGALCTVFAMGLVSAKRKVKLE